MRTGHEEQGTRRTTNTETLTSNKTLLAPPSARMSSHRKIPLAPSPCDSPLSSFPSPHLPPRPLSSPLRSLPPSSPNSTFVPPSLLPLVFPPLSLRPPSLVLLSRPCIPPFISHPFPSTLKKTYRQQLSFDGRVPHNGGARVERWPCPVLWYSWASKFTNTSPPPPPTHPHPV